MISIVICSVDQRKFRAIADNYLRLLGDEPFEIIGVHDARSMCEGYNRGLRRATGDPVIFCHDDIEILAADFKDRLKGHLRHYDLIGVAGTTKLIKPRWPVAGPPYIYGQIAHVNAAENCFDVYIFGTPTRAVSGIQALDGIFLATTRRVLEAVSFDEQTFTDFHLYDLDFSFTAYLRGFRLGVCNDLPLIHTSPGHYGDEWGRQAMRFYEKYKAHMHPGDVRKGTLMKVQVNTREEVLEVMTPGHWGES
jgi:Glycosyltransferase like family